MFIKSILASALLASSTATAFHGPATNVIKSTSKHTASALHMSGGTLAAPALKAPPALYEGAVAAGAAKASAPWAKIFKLGVVSGAHIGFGSYLAITVGGACPGIASTNPGLQKVRTVAKLSLILLKLI